MAIERDPALAAALDIVRERRCVFVAGLPGTGKTVLVRQTALLAQREGRSVHLLQWDDARLRFERPEILARYPENDGVTHAAIRIAAGRWAREAVARWHAAHPGGADILVGETPLAGERLMSLARPGRDDAEALLAGPGTLFVVPVPTAAVRAAMERSRERSIDVAGTHDAVSARPHLVRWHWSELERVAADLGIGVRSPGAWDPDLYAAVYSRLLKHRRHRIVAVSSVVPAGAAAAPGSALALAPAPAEVARWIGEQLARPDDEIEREAADWHRTVTR